MIAFATSSTWGRSASISRASATCSASAPAASATARTYGDARDRGGADDADAIAERRGDDLRRAAAGADRARLDDRPCRPEQLLAGAGHAAAEHDALRFEDVDD